LARIFNAKVIELQPSHSLPERLPFYWKYLTTFLLQPMRRIY
jgi:hypothetical protein